ncbi:chemotaxis protein CheC [Sedimentibacter sp.]|uniref:chemotaxis protein CheC n=1 Tax=Sedimentibacter sp. TaxID=1960295 RepID=UPI0028A9DCF3|nr:chemotaxis protein CheC [Sedimentibacter sp.]
MNDRNLELDILRELFNISVGKASSLLSEIIDRKIILNVPDVKIINVENKEFNIQECLHEKSDSLFMISSISFEYELKGKASLIFSAEKMRTFIDLCISNYETEDYFEISFSDIDFDVIKEIGNIILNSVVGEVGNLLEIKLTYTLPEVKFYNGDEFFEDADYSSVLILNITFLIENTKIEGAIFVHLSIDSLSDLMKKINEIKDELNE